MICPIDASDAIRPHGSSSLSLSLMRDEELVSLAQSGIASAAEPLVSRYRDLVRSRANRFYLSGADHDDVCQEGMIGLFKAIRSFRADRHESFKGFADLCILRQIQTAVKASLRHKHAALNCCSTLAGLEDQGLGREHASGPRAEGAGELPLVLWDQLTAFERAVLEAYLAGLSYVEIGRELSCLPKSVDNALQRVKRKVLVLLHA